MSAFTDWNNLLLSEYFSPAPVGEDVWIQTSRNELDSFGLHLGGAVGLIAAVKRGPEWLDSTIANCAEAAFRLAKLRRANLRLSNYADPGLHNECYRDLKAPTYLPYLALWVLASSEAGEGFYAQVASLLEQPFPNIPALTAAMKEVWIDLERWSTVEVGGRFGVFKVRIIGDHQFVGIPKSQCMASRKDINGLRQLFKTCGLRPRQPLSATIFSQIVDHGCDAYYLSNGLKYAMRERSYHEPLRSLLAGMLTSWDGRSPRAIGVRSGQNQSGVVADELEDEMTLKLAPSGDDAECWEIQWRFPAAGHANVCTLVIEAVKIASNLEPSGDSFSSYGSMHQEASRAVLLKSSTGEVQVRAEYNDEDAYEVGGGDRTCHIVKRDLRILVWDAPDPRLGDELVEHDLPISGPCYLLSSSNYRGKLSRYLENEEIANEPLSTGGLPTGWTLTCIFDAARLSHDQRDWLTDGNALPEAKARMRFVGGRPIIRGGTKVYPFYDLPTLELEAPDATKPKAEGLSLKELAGGLVNVSRSPIRRFKIEVLDAERAAFEVKAVHVNESLANLRLRVSIYEGTGVGDHRQFALDCFGRSVLSGIGLRGAIVNEAFPGVDTAVEGESLVLELEDLQRITGTLPNENIAAKFLDSLAQLGSIAYGTARDQINRLAEEARPIVQPALLLMELRSRGHLEIQTDDKGHMVRVHAVPPTLYSLQATHEGLELFGVCGTLRLQHWVDLSNEEEFLILIEGQVADRLPVIRLAAVDGTSVQQAARNLGFGFAKMPSYAISRWAASLVQATSELSAWGWGNFAANIGQLQRLQPACAQFFSVANGSMAVDHKTGRQLFRLDDPSIPGLQVYVLGSIQPNEMTSFSFIHDSRWGVWISISAFASMLKEHFAIGDASPWPIHYDETSRSFWIPARLRPPAVIERSLTLCSGGGPLEILAKGIQEGGHTKLVNVSTGVQIGMASCVYEGLASGIWLCYRWIPRSIAHRIASLLGGKISPLSNYSGGR